MERLDKILANTGRWSRKEARELIRAGRVSVDGVTARAPEDKADPAAVFTVDGERISGEKQVYLMLHKPAGLVSATEDPRQPTVLELLPEHLRRVGLFPAGRLDKDTEGLLLLTNDGPLAHRLLSPRHHVDKTYFVRVDGALGREDAEAFAAGMTHRQGLHRGVLRRGAELSGGGAGAAGHRPRYPARGQVPPDQAHAGGPGEAGGVPQAPDHGASVPGSCPGEGGVAAPDGGGAGSSGRKTKDLTKMQGDFARDGENPAKLTCIFCWNPLS